MASAHVLKLRKGAHLSATEEAVLSGLAQRVIAVPARRDVVSDGTSTRSVPLILDGWACRYRVLENGKRQIISLFLPGDICEPFGALPRVTGYPIGALTPLRVAWLPLEDLSRAARDYPSLNKALWWDLLLTETLVHEGMVSLGRRSAMERMAYLFCELHFRLSLVDLVRDDVFDMPVTQADIADLLGLSSVHVNRSLQELRGSGIISLRWQHLEIHRVSALCDLALWDPIYLDFGDVVPMAAPGAATG